MDNSNNQYDIIRRIRREGDAVLSLARDGAEGTFRILKRYEPDIPDYAEPAYTNGLNRFMKDCEQYITAQPAGCAVAAAEFQRDGKSVVLVSAPFEGTPWRDYWRGEGSVMPLADRLRMLLPVLQTVAAANKAGIQFQAIDADAVYVSRYTVILADFGTAVPFEPWRQAYMLGRLLHGMGFDAAALPPALGNALRRALFTDPATRYPDADSFVRNIAAYFTTSQTPQPNVVPYAAPRNQNKGCLKAVVITAIVFLALSIITVVAMRGVGISSNTPSSTWNFDYDMDMPDIAFPDFNNYDFMTDAPAATTAPVQDDYDYDYDDYDYEDYRGAVDAAYVRYDFWDLHSLYDGLVTEANGKVFYRIRDKGEAVLVSEDIKTGERTDLLWNYIPAFLCADGGNLYFIDCLDNFALYRMPQTGGEPERLYDAPCTFLTFGRDKESLFFSDMANGGDLTRIQMSNLDQTALVDLDAAANHIVYDAANNALYYTDANENDSIFRLNPSTNEAEEIGIFGYDLQLSDGYLYYMGSTGFLYRYNLETGKSERVVRDGVYAYVVHGDKLYYIDENNGYNAYVQNAGGGGATLLIEEDVDMLWVAGGKLYYTSYDDYGAMKRCDMDGGNVEMLDRE